MVLKGSVSVIRRQQDFKPYYTSTSTFIQPENISSARECNNDSQRTDAIETGRDSALQ